MERIKAIVGIATLACVAACGGGGGGGGGVGGVPEVPGGVAAFAGDGEVTVSWSAVGGAEGYTLFWSTAPGVTPANGNALAGVSSPYLHTGLSNGTSYYYVVTASNANGTSAASSQVTAMPLAGGPSIDPPWAGATPQQVVAFDYDGAETTFWNGAQLKTAIQNLTPGTRLEIGAGTYSVNSFFTINLVGTAANPIWIAAKAGETPVITRPDAWQNTVNLGSGGATRYLALQGLEITGGDTALRIWNCENVWVDSCHIHDCGGPAIEANSVDTAWLYLNRNHIHDTAGKGEGMYLGGNNGSVITHDSIIALNDIHDTGGSQGDGIELKQGSYGNWIVQNLVRDTNYPGILVYGTGGMPFNLIERNTCYRSGDNVMQVQGEAIVRNNLLIDGGLAFSSADHQGQVRDLTVVHNTMINTGRAVNLSNWGGRPNMTFANNAAYSKTGDAVRINGAAGVEFVGNVTYGAVVGVGAGYVEGAGLGDFVNVTWTATQLDARPTPLSPIIGAGDFVWAVVDDITAAPRSNPLDPGCYDGP